MSSYKDASMGGIANVEEIEDNLQNAVTNAEEYAKAEAQGLHDRIIHYRKSDFEEIKKEVTEEFEREYVEEDHTVSKEEFFKIIRFKNELNEATPYVDFKHDTEEERDALYQRYLDDRRAYCLREKIKQARARDIIYDSMTEEQIEESCSLYYACVLKDTLVGIKESTLAAKATFGSKERKVVNAWNDIENAAYDEVRYLEATEVERTEILDDEKVAKKEKIKGAIGNAFKALGGGAMLGFVGGTAVSVISRGGIPIEPSIGFGTLAVSAAALTLCGVFTYKEFTENKKAVQRAKELGVYDLIIEKYKASKAMYDYDSELAKQANLAERINEEFPEEPVIMRR